MPHDAPLPASEAATDALHNAILTLLQDAGYWPEAPTAESVFIEAKLYHLLTDHAE